MVHLTNINYSTELKINKIKKTQILVPAGQHWEKASRLTANIIITSGILIWVIKMASYAKNWAYSEEQKHTEAQPEIKKLPKEQNDKPRQTYFEYSKGTRTRL